MLVFDTDEKKWKQLINNPENQDYTDDDDWQDAFENNTINANIWKEKFTIDDPSVKEYDLQHKPVENSVQVYINGIEQIEGDYDQYTIDYDNNKLIFNDDIDYVEWDQIYVKYIYV